MTNEIKSQNRVILFWKRNLMNVDLGIAILISIIFLLILPKILEPTLLSDWLSSIKTSLYPVIATISGALLGFVITGVSILIAFSESDNLRLLKKTKQFKNIFKVYFRAIYYLAITTLISVFGIVINANLSVPIFWILVISSVVSLVGLYRCIWVLEKVVEIVHKEKKYVNQ